MPSIEEKSSAVLGEIMSLVNSGHWSQKAKSRDRAYLWFLKWKFKKNIPKNGLNTSYIIKIISQ